MPDNPQPISFTVPAVPVAQPRQRHRLIATKAGRTFTHNYTPANHPVQAFKAAVQLAAHSAYHGPPLEGPLHLMLTFLLPRPARLIWKNRPMPRLPHDKKPDLDNLLKSFTDALSSILWRDDAQIAATVLAKMYAAGDEQPATYVHLHPFSTLDMTK